MLYNIAFILENRSMSNDFIRDRGYSTLGSRLKRTGERLQAEVTRLAKLEGHDVPAAHMTILSALDQHAPVTVGALANLLGIAQPGVTRSLAALEEQGLITSSKQPGDQRQRMIELSRKGTAFIARTRTDLWERVTQAVAEICEPLSGSILDQLAAIEAALDAEPLDRRAAKPRKD
jgi:DNA-binding MarR family transcriptional regulator